MKRARQTMSAWALAVVGLLWLGVTGCCVVPSAPSSCARSEKLLAVVSEAEKQGRFSGEVLISRDGKIIFQHRAGLASHELGVPFTSQIRYKIFSMTKQFTAAAIMLLQRDGKLSIEDSVARFLPEAPPAWREVTLRHLLTHTSGIPLSESDLATHQRPTQYESVAAAVRELSDQGLRSKPGESFAYSNAGYTVLGAVVEKASGQSYADFLRDRIFMPSGMVHSEVEVGVFDTERPTEDLGTAVAPNLASGYRGLPGRLTPTTSTVYVIAGAGGVYSTPEDVWRYDNALREGRVLSLDQQKCMVDGGFRQAGLAGVGFGWFVRERHGRQMLSHSGGDNGFAVEYARIPTEGLCVIVFTNLGFANPEKLRDQLMEILLAEP